MSIFTASLAALLLFIGCAHLGGADRPLPMRELARGAFSAISDRKEGVLKSEKEWAEFWKQHAATSTGLKQPTVDLSKEMVVAVMMGRRNTGGYSVRIEQVEESTETIKVSYSEREPKPGGMTLQALSAPFHMVAVAQSQKPVTFKKVAPSSAAKR